MLSYRHAYHAGNHADVLKHLVLVGALEQLCAKDKPLWYIDTHAGAGHYSLTHGPAAHHAEHAQGIAPLWNAAGLPPLLARYVELVRGLNGRGALRAYPGSPLIANAVLRRQDWLWLHELHPADARALTREFRGRSAHVRVVEGDGFAGLRALLPPQPRRALAMIDPSYELKEDYRAVVKALREALEKFSSGVYLLWYPLLARRESRDLAARLEGLAPKWLHVTLAVRRASVETGLHGSGMYVINPPWQLRDALNACGDTLVSLLARPGEGEFRLTASAD